MAFPSKGDDEQVLVQRKSNARVLTLNRTKQLNALSFYMVSRLLEIFSEDEKDSDIKLVVVKGNGRAFCAGGDVAAVARDGSKGDWRFGANFFQSEFKLNYLMATYSKPQVSILNGIVMGGGAGVSVHGRFRVVTENTCFQVFAMPETALGLFPDIGSSYFLSRLPGFLGEYAGLTGARLDGAEMLACGLATHFVPSSKLSLLEEALCKVETSDPNAVSAIINKYSEQPFLKEDSVYHRMDVINKCFSKKAVEEILSSLEVEATRKADPWISATIQSLKKASPTSLKIFLRSIRQGRLQGVGQCLVSDYRVVCHILKGHYSKDFFEGCRAILIDKDRNPKWEPSKLELLSDSDVNRYFSKLDDKGWKDLELPKRFNNLPTYAISKL
uniref:3-hydroxyisobutyryl-CoA hydrolase n=1 Tax=Glycine max TaxID=3847 RepID=I1MM39_SOYBN